ncbi:MAG TPA: helix-turn-helix domain-containing protein [Candidatus Sulfotelmatobacter sp.]|nr:helix-turn-helix domain-containing protein [Candidatus Sulfotelmatobacter sp.]
MTREEKVLILAWREFRKTNGGYIQRHGLGLKLGRALQAARAKFRNQGRKGKSFQVIYEAVGIPRNTAYRWIEKYVSSGIKPEEWIEQAKAKLATAEEVKQERGRKASRDFNRRVSAFLKTVEPRLLKADQIVKANSRPADWEKRPHWHALGDQLLSCDFIGNADLKARVLASGQDFPSLKTIQRIREWVGRPLGPYGKRADTSQTPQSEPVSYRMTTLTRQELNRKAAKARWGQRTTKGQ